ncbi:hypothetical protein [Lunatibacter salilacus]|nr:hypothetical protein [Lunatibacter salilacus]
MDFFSILLLGALLTYVIKDKVYYYIQETEQALSCEEIEKVFALG